MKPVQYLSVVHLAILLFLAPGMFGCSVIGYFIGSQIDDGKADRDTLYVNGAMQLKSGDEVQVFLTDSSIVKGEFLAFANLNPTDYSERYATFMHDHGPRMNVPQPGDSIVWRTSASRPPIAGVFRGYGVGSLLVQMINRSKTEHLLLEHITSLEREENIPFDLARLQYMSKGNRLPLNTSLMIQSDPDIKRIPLDDIAHVERTLTSNGKWIGGGIGLAVDAGVLIYISTLFKDSFKGGVGGAWK